MAADRDAYDIVFESEGPMGLDIESSTDGRDAWVRSSANPKIQKGHILVAVNDQPLEGLRFEEILEKVQKAKHPRKLSFSSKKRPEEEESDLPLPPDFFAKLPPLTKEEEAQIKKFMDDNLKEALRMATASAESLNLTLAMEKNGVTVHTCAAKGGEGINIVRAQTKVNIAADLFMTSALAGNNEDFQRIFTMLDPMFRDGQVIYKIPNTWTKFGDKEPNPENVNLPLYSVKWAAYALPFPLWWRDFIFCELTCWTKEGFGVSLAMSFPLATAKVPSLEDSHKLVRGSIGMSGYLWRNVEGKDQTNPETMQIDITYLLQVDPKGALPPWAVNLTGAQQGMNCLRVVNYAEEQRNIVLSMYGQNPETNRLEAVKRVVPKGEVFELGFSSTKDGQTLVVDWVLDENDISFSVEDSSGKVLHSLSKGAHTRDGKPYFGRVKLGPKGKYVMKFDNSYSWFTSKTVFYHFTIV